MQRQPHKCAHCKKSYIPEKAGQKFCKPAHRQAAYRKRKAKTQRPQQQGEKAAIAAVCVHCNGTFWASRRSAKFCGVSCRVIHHDALRAAIPDALTTLYSIPQEKALDLLDTQPIKQIRSVLETAGYRYQHEQRAWVQRAA
jgi:hypothetical protein